MNLLRFENASSRLSNYLLFLALSSPALVACSDPSDGDLEDGTGGADASGGETSTGGTSTTGGAPATGAASATGGTASTGGEASTGGTSTTGGAPATGGNTSTGGEEAGAEVGDPCEVDDDCAPIKGETAVCRTEWPGGYCTRPCIHDVFSCGFTATCSAPNSDSLAFGEEGICLATCGFCQPGYQCVNIACIPE